MWPIKRCLEGTSITGSIWKSWFIPNFVKRKGDSIMNPDIGFELFTQRIYQKLVDNDVLKPTKVQHNVKLTGKSGCEHQIDVYWEYEIAGNMHRVAIECKNYDSQVPIGKVRDFFGVLRDHVSFFRIVRMFRPSFRA